MNEHLKSLCDFVAAVALKEGYTSEDVVGHMAAAVRPIEDAERACRVARLASSVTFEHACDRILYTSVMWWDAARTGEFFDALRARFPKRKRSIRSIELWARAAVEHYEEADYDEAARCYRHAIEVLDRFSW